MDSFGFWAILAVLLAFNVAWSMGANDVANSMGTAIGSRVLSLRQALVIAGILEFAGAVLFSQRVVTRLATNITDAAQFADQPQTLLIGMVAVLLASGLWIQIATLLGLPVSSTHAIVGAIAGFSYVAAGASSINGSALGQLTLAWVLSPILSGLIAAILYATVRQWVLTNPLPLNQWQEWCPWLSTLLVVVFGAVIAPIFHNVQLLPQLSLPTHTYLVIGGMGAIALLTGQSWQNPGSLTSSSDELLPGSNLLEPRFGRFQILSSSFVAFAHGANDVGNAIAPLVVIFAILHANAVPTENLTVPLWILLLGGVAIIAGLAVQGRNVITTVGEKITELQPSSGFCAELATAATVLLASGLGFPVSTSHVLVGSLVGISTVNQSTTKSYGTIGSIISAWALTVPIATGLGSISYVILKSVFG
ncbi:MAG: inorganic phosphate transporter [Cyanothece sp. SIO2G6]|nr:inorganic phosphate transporter [Cyanothece sp. SIO2G6]